MLDTVHKILKPGGVFCLDTPNRRVTRLHYPDTYSHPDHKIEYTAELLSEKLTGHGFSIVERFGVLDCRRMLAAPLQSFKVEVQQLSQAARMQPVALPLSRFAAAILTSCR